MFSGFKNFIARGNVVDLAVAVVIGGAFGKIVTGVVDSFINPLIAMLFGQPNFDSVAFTLSGTLFPIGKVITAGVNFLLVSFAVYFFIVLPMNKLKEFNKKDEPEKPAVTPEDILLLREIRDQLQKMQAKN